MLEKLKALDRRFIAWKARPLTQALGGAALLLLLAALALLQLASPVPFPIWRWPFSLPHIPAAAKGLEMFAVGCIRLRVADPIRQRRLSSRAALVALGLALVAAALSFAGRAG
ncbi:MAG TPA: hypothetical protein VGE07_11665 [Herpetosiphonaceae bacterium]